MTDIEKLHQTLAEIGVAHNRGDASIEIEESEQSPMFGYAAQFDFDETGKFEQFRITV